MTTTVMPNPVLVDMMFGGLFKITGIVYELGVAGSYRVRLFDRKSGVCVSETWSSANGAYTFNNIAYKYKGYFVVAFDHGVNARPEAGIVDLVTPELME